MGPVASGALGLGAGLLAGMLSEAYGTGTVHNPAEILASQDRTKTVAVATGLLGLGLLAMGGSDSGKAFGGMLAMGSGLSFIMSRETESFYGA